MLPSVLQMTHPDLGPQSDLTLKLQIHYSNPAAHPHGAIVCPSFERRKFSGPDAWWPSATEATLQYHMSPQRKTPAQSPS